MPTRPQQPLVKLDAVADLFGKPASWMLHWGSLTTFLICILMLTIAAFVHYPDTIDVRISLTSSSPPTQVLAYSSGTLEELYVQDNDSVEKGQKIALIANTANAQDIEQLNKDLQTLAKIKQASDLIDFELQEQLNLGIIGADYIKLLNHNSRLQYYLERSKAANKIRGIHQQLEQYLSQNQHIEEQKKQLTEELAIAQKNLDRQSKLLQNGSASELEVDQARSELLRIQRHLKVQDNLILENQISIQALEISKININEELSDQINEQWLGFKQQVRILQQALLDWQDQYLITAKSKGTLNLFQQITKGQYVYQESVLANIVNTDSTAQYLAEAYTNHQAIGQLKNGQTVFISLDAYPYRTYGQVKGQLQQIALAPQQNTAKQEVQNAYRLLIELPQGLRSTYNKTLDFRQNLSGQAKIITEDRSLLSRIFDRFKSLNNNQ